MTSARPVTVSTVELRDAFDFVSAGSLFEHCAYICIDTGRIFWTSISADLEKDGLPEDLETSDRYITVPHKNNLGLGRNLALAIVSQELPNDYDTVAGFFRRKGARPLQEAARISRHAGGMVHIRRERDHDSVAWLVRGEFHSTC
jgi:hypothetical protein